MSPLQVLLHNSRQLRDEATLGEAGVTSGATLSVTSRLRGGGGDGGSTGAESRSCYLEMYAEKKPDKVSSSWTACYGRPPVVRWLKTNIASKTSCTSISVGC